MPVEMIECAYRISAKAAIFNKANEIFLIRGLDGSWELPGGGIEHGESFQLALARELQEECGLALDKMSKSPLYFWMYHNPKSQKATWKGAVAYRVKAHGTLTKSDECQEWGYFGLAEIGQLKLHDNTKQFVSDYLLAIEWRDLGKLRKQIINIGRRLLQSNRLRYWQSI